VTLLTGSSSADIPAPIADVWPVVQDVETAPGWQNMLDRIEVVQRDAEGRPSIADTVTDAKVRSISVRVRFSYEPPHRVVWQRIESDDLDQMEGSWELEELDAGCTRATYRLEIDPGHVGIMARPLEKMLRPLVVGGRAHELSREVQSRTGTAPSR
jgi:uncharacterized protein YndB with AHSA1/START domain